MDSKTIKGTALWNDVWKMRALYLMLTPGLLWYIIYKYVPMIGLVIAFKDYNIVEGVAASPWADPWHKYFTQFFHSPYFSQLLTNTLLISFYKLIFGIAPPIVLAILIHECRSLVMKKWVQTLSFMPHFLSWVIIYGIVIAFFSETSGVVNRFIVENGSKAIPFLTSTDWFRSVLVASDVWQNLGWGAIIYLAAISSIDPSLYEACRVDGGGRFRMIWNITLPGIRSVIVLMFILKVGHILDAGFEQIYIMYNIQVYEVADIIDTWVYRTGLQQMNFSLASAVGLFKSLFGLVLVLVSNSLAKKWGESIW
ncbi:ABC transporter permease subunit [Paenibacillus pasadenensis]|uniref:ABC transporter permease n=1 Tax=Paenibacillus pasadenensis TaxID=217090 RepID=UPI00203EDA24|nr:ABC transporter permease subunit [Paenibacillus pasadenensis]MCM3748700.1 ABC transporter permease subunit [Paenibacillus pasadenensis]